MQLATELAGRTPAGRKRRIVLRFLASPVKLVGDERVEGIEIVRNELVADDDGWLSARPTNATETIETGLVLRAVGYRGRPLPGVPFDDQRATINNLDGRVMDPETAEPIPGLYTAGWIKRGPSGIIGTNKKCANDTVAQLAADHAAGALPTPAKRDDDIAELLAERAPRHVDYAGWQRIDQHEQALGEPQGRPRVKLVDVDQMLDVAHAGAGAAAD